MAKLLLVTPNFFPDKTGIGVTATDCARFLSELGHEVSVVSAVPYYPEWKVHEGYRGKLFSEELIQNCRVTRVCLYVPQKKTTLRRIFHELSFSLLVLLRVVSKRFDQIICITPPLSTAAAVATVAWVRRKPFATYVKDIQPDTAICLGMLRNSLVIAGSKLLEKWVYRRSSRVFVLSEGMRRNLIEKGVAREAVQVIPDSIETDVLGNSSASEREKFKKLWEGEGKFVVLYSGNIGVKQNPELIVDIANLLKDEEGVLFIVVGDGVMKEALVSKAEQYDLQNIRFFPLCERKDLGAMLSSADVLLAPQKKEILEVALPSKILAYLCSRKPIIAAAHEASEVARVLTENQAGLVVEPEDPVSIAEKILELKDNPVKAREQGERGYAFVSSRFDHTVVKESYYRPLFGLNVARTDSRS